MGESEFSEEVTIETAQATEPDSPTALVQLELWNTHAKLRWVAPLEDGGAEVTSYQVDIIGVTNPDEPPRQLFVEPLLPGGVPPQTLLFDGLVFSHVYSVTVSAINFVGASAPTEALEIYTFRDGNCIGDPEPPGGESFDRD